MQYTAGEFLDLPQDSQIRLLFEHGTFVTSIRYYAHKVNLYLLNAYYVEVFVHHKKGVIDRISLLDTGHSRMKFYCDQIRLEKSLAA